MHHLYHALDRVGCRIGRCQPASPAPPGGPVTPPCVAGWIVERRRGVCRPTGVRLGGRIAPTPRCSASVPPPTPPPDRDVPRADVAEVNVDGGAGSGQELASGVGPSSPTGHASWRVGLMSRYRISAPRPLPVLACPPAPHLAVSSPLADWATTALVHCSPTGRGHVDTSARTTMLHHPRTGHLRAQASRPMAPSAHQLPLAGVLTGCLRARPLVVAQSAADYPPTVGSPPTPTTCARSSRPSKGSPDSTACSTTRSSRRRRRRPATTIRAVSGHVTITIRTIWYRETRNGSRYVQRRRVLEQKSGIRTLAPRPLGRVKDRAQEG